MIRAWILGLGNLALCNVVAWRHLGLKVTRARCFQARGAEHRGPEVLDGYDSGINLVVDGGALSK